MAPTSLRQSRMIASSPRSRMRAGCSPLLFWLDRCASRWHLDTEINVRDQSVVRALRLGMVRQPRSKRPRRPASLSVVIFGANLRKAREQLGLSQEQLAERAGTAGRSYISSIEDGQQNISFHTAEALAKAVGMTLQQL